MAEAFGEMKKLPFDEEVRQRIAHYAQRRALGVGNATAAEAVAEGTAARTSAGWGMRSLLGWGPAAVVGGALGAGALMKEAVEPAVVGMMAGPGPLTPQFKKTVQDAGGTDAYIRSLNATPTVPAPAPDEAFVSGAMQGSQGGYKAPATPVPLTNGMPYQPVTSTDQRDEQGNLVNRTITGSGSRGYGVAPTPGFTPSNTLGGMYATLYGAAAEQGQARRSTTLAAKQAELTQNLLLRGPAAENDMIKARLAREVYAKTGDAQLAAHTLAGGAPPADLFVTEPSMTGKPEEVRVRTNKRTGAVEQVKPAPIVQPITLAQAIASAKKNRTYQSDEQVRRDISRMPGYKLVD